MDQRGAQLTPLGELDDLRSLVARPGDVLTVCLPLRPANEELAAEVRLEWRALREEAERAGAPSEALAVVDRAVAGAHRDHAGLHVVVPRDARPHVEGLERPPARGSVSWGPVPALTPLLADRQRRQPHVVVLVDRQGADIVAVTGRTGADSPDGGATGGDGGDGGDGRTTTTVDGATFPLRKVAPGGWSQRRFQQHAEETWQRNMTEVAGEVTAQAQRVDARFVALGGDERAVGLLVDHLPVAVRELVRPLTVTRATDGSAARLDDEVDRVLDGWLHGEMAKTADTYREELGQGDRAVAGPDQTLDALRAARVAQLLVAGGATGADGVTGGAAGGPASTDAEPGGTGGRAWIGATPEDVALSRDALLEGSEARSTPLLDAAIAAALATGADVRVLPPEPAPSASADAAAVADLLDLPGGLGALLRW